jgi:hypothetical protein
MISAMIILMGVLVLGMVVATAVTALTELEDVLQER